MLHNGHETRVTVRPISVDYRMISEHAVSSSVEQAESVLLQQLGFRAGARLGLVSIDWITRKVC